LVQKSFERKSCLSTIRLGVQAQKLQLQLFQRALVFVPGCFFQPLLLDDLLDTFLGAPLWIQAERSSEIGVPELRKFEAKI
jgi:hypothetical protein